MSAYNLKVFVYRDFIQFRIYSKPITKTDSETDLEEKAKDDYFQAELEDLYGDRIEKNEEKTKKTIQEKKARSDRVSINRTVQNIYEYALNNKWDYFITLTFTRQKVDRMNYDICMLKARKWFDNQRQRYSSQLKYLLVPEEHKDGAWHVHGLISDCGNMKFEDSGRVAIGKKAYKRTKNNSHYPTIYNMSGWKNGFSTAIKVGDSSEDSARMASYITKYITKDLCVKIPGKRRFYPSNNLEKAERYEYNLAYDVIEDMIYSYDIDYIKVQNIPEAKQKIKYVTVKM